MRVGATFVAMLDPFGGTKSLELPGMSVKVRVVIFKLRCDDAIRYQIAFYGACDHQIRKREICGPEPPAVFVAKIVLDSGSILQLGMQSSTVVDFAQQVRRLVRREFKPCVTEPATC